MVLIEKAQEVSSLLRLCDQFGRYGGEEFAVILPETDLTGALDVAERICKAIEKLVIKFQDKSIRISTSVGVATINPNDKRYEDLISNADLALYEAKATGRNKVCAAREIEYTIKK